MKAILLWIIKAITCEVVSKSLQPKNQQKPNIRYKI